MKVNFNKEEKNVNGLTLTSGDFETMVKKRQQCLSEMEELINKAFADYDGGMFLIIRVNEDENGMPIGAKTTVGGVGGLESQIALIKNTKKAIDNVVDDTVKLVSKNPEAMLAFLDALLEEAKEDLEGFNKESRGKK